MQSERAHLVEYIRKDVLCIRAITRGRGCTVARLRPAEHARKLREEARGCIGVGRPVAAGAGGVQVVILLSPRGVRQDIVRIRYSLQPHVSATSNELTETVRRTWNRSVAAFFSAGGAFTSLSGCVLGNCRHETRRECCQRRRDTHLRDSFLYAVRISSWVAVWATLRRS